jgi:hypothetical protein
MTITISGIFKQTKGKLHGDSYLGIHCVCFRGRYAKQSGIKCLDIFNETTPFVVDGSGAIRALVKIIIRIPPFMGNRPNGIGSTEQPVM